MSARLRRPAWVEGEIKIVPEWAHSLATVLSPWFAWGFRYSLFVALVQLAVGGLAGYYLTERWQRWRQRREFQARTLAKFSELSYEMMDRLSELLMWRIKQPTQAQAEKQRELLTRWTVFVSMRGEVMASFGRAFVLQGAFQGVFKTLNTLRGLLKEMTPVPQERFELDQEQYLAYREAVVALMVHKMGLLSDTELKAELDRCGARLQSVEAKRAKGAEEGPPLTDAAS